MSKGQRVRAVAIAVAAAVVVAPLGGCSNSRRISIVSDGRVAVVGQPSLVTISGADARHAVRVTITSTDARGVAWRSVTRLRADARGRVVFDAGPLIAVMQPQSADPIGAYFWNTDASFQVTVAGASTTVVRELARQAVQRTTVTADGLVGAYYDPAGPGRHSAVLLIGGSEGGVPGPLLPYVLAGAGHPVLALAYFGAGRLPKTLSRIPLEYFATALRWLARQPGVDAGRIVIDGASRGGEAALLVASTYPKLVHGVIAGVPSDVSLCSYPGCAGPAWTLHGEPVPFTREFDDPYPTDSPHAVIKVEKIDGPVLLNCGGQDDIWSSCPYAQAVTARLAHSDYAHQLQACQPCDHYVGRGIPDEPYATVGPAAPNSADVHAYPAFFTATLHLLDTLPA
jgi:dienelactone hydrolase